MKTGYAHFLNHEFAMQPTQTYAKPMPNIFA